METDSSQKQNHPKHMSTRSLKGGLHVMMDPAFLTEFRLHCAPDVTAPHSFNMLLQQCAKEQILSVISRKHSTTAGGTLCTQKLAQRRSEGPRNDPKWPPHHNASPLRAQNSHRATTSGWQGNFKLTPTQVALQEFQTLSLYDAWENLGAPTLRASYSQP